MAEFQSGDLVKYVRPHPADAGMVYQVQAVREDDEGAWVLLVEEAEDNVPVAEGVYGGFGGWEEAKEFELVQ